MQITVRKGTAADAEALARLRWRWRSDEHGDTGTDEATFLDSFTGWVVAHMATHVPFLAEVDGRVVGMAWFMVADRVPGISPRPRRTGDVQSVYVVPELRDRGVGAMVLDAVLAEARELELEHVTVHSSDRAVPLYQRKASSTTGASYSGCQSRASDWFVVASPAVAAASRAGATGGCPERHLDRFLRGRDRAHPGHHRAR